MNTPMYLLIIAALYICFGDACDPSTGPPGLTRCVKYSEYYGYQWHTCRSNTYIQTKNQYECTGNTVKYCYYPCMIDVYDQSRGDVKSECRCSRFDFPKLTTLPAWCYSPSGSTCSWYRECLSEAYPQCETNEDDYSVKFGENFCHLYDKHYKFFSTEGKQWIDDAQKCLQLQTVPLIDPPRIKTCANLKSKAFDSHRSCYLKPNARASLSYCHFNINSELIIFWSMKSTFVQSYWPSLKILLDVMGECIQAKRNSTDVQNLKNKIEEKVNKNTTDSNRTDTISETDERIKAWLEDPLPPIQVEMSILRRNGESKEDIARSYFAGKIVDAVALQNKWKESGLAWFTYANKMTPPHTNVMSIKLLVDDHDKYHIETADVNISSSASPNTTKILLELSKAVLNGTLNFHVDGESVEIIKMKGCLDWNCKELAFNVTSWKFNESDVMLLPTKPKVDTKDPTTKSTEDDAVSTTKPPENSALDYHGAMRSISLFACFVILLLSNLYA